MSQKKLPAWNALYKKAESTANQVKNEAEKLNIPLAVSIEPSSEPSGFTSWSWFMTFKSSEVEVEVIASPSLESFMIEDGYGRFELEADADEFNQIMIKRLNDR